MRPTLSLLFTLVIPLILCLSCSEEQDFDQFDDLNINPAVASSIFSFVADEDFINTLTAVNTFYTQTFIFEAFSEQFVAERLLEGTITYEFENTTSKPLNIIVEFLDAGDNVLDFENFNIAQGPNETQTRNVEYGPNGKPLDILINTASIRVTGRNLGDTVSVSPEQDARVTMQSAAEFIFELVE
ncbi:hypothetical protein [Flagellimonas meridianipacifica]|uniref:Uncharacterized protein n=1 Tax=Flagellimonas meridianipacifica TaxID=1080225 RepID=A0A2T0M885_9FLAO|nr:hypothetical protein [Allomuricauda pacifica]PRX53685.1 hypothetical protein CLV81_2072 [Allomuricauda pacifica]